MDFRLFINQQEVDRFDDQEEAEQTARLAAADDDNAEKVVTLQGEFSDGRYGGGIQSRTYFNDGSYA